MVKQQLQSALMQLLKEGQRVAVPAHGMSMYPLLRPGDTLLVEPRPPLIGDIGVFYHNGLLVAHRLLHQKGNIYYFKGDGLIMPDAPVESGKVLGTVTQCTRKNRAISCNTFSFRLFKRFIPYTHAFSGRLFFYLGRISLRLQNK